MTIQLRDKKQCLILNLKYIRTQITKICDKPKNLNAVDNERSSFIISFVKYLVRQKKDNYPLRGITKEERRFTGEGESGRLTLVQKVRLASSF